MTAKAGKVVSITILSRAYEHTLPFIERDNTHKAALQLRATRIKKGKLETIRQDYEMKIAKCTPHPAELSAPRNKSKEAGTTLQLLDLSIRQLESEPGVLDTESQEIRWDVVTLMTTSRN